MTLRRVWAAIAAAGLIFGFAACSGGQQPAETTKPSMTNESGSMPVTIKHALGETVIEKKPERVATLGWKSHEVALALGVVPVGMTKITWGDDDDNGIMPWVEEKLKELGGDTPALFDETDSIPFEDVAATKPDVILAAYSGITEEDYKQLSKIAPTVAYPGKPWTTSFEDTIMINAKAMGMEAEGQKLLDDLNKKIKETVAKHPGLEGKKILFTSFGNEKDKSEIGFYQLGDARPAFLKQIGYGVPKIVEEKSKDADSFWVTVSREKPELFKDVDLIVSYGSDDPAENEKALKAMQADPLMGRIPAIKKGHVAYLGNGPVASAANPSPLSIPDGLDKYLGALEKAATK